MSNVTKYLFALITTLILIVLVTQLTSCTLSFQNLSTHEVKGSDVEDTVKETDDVTPTVTVPVKLVPGV